MRHRIARRRLLHAGAAAAADPILAEPFHLDKGHLVVPDRPGQGIAWTETAVARFAL